MRKVIIALHNLRDALIRPGLLDGTQAEIDKEIVPLQKKLHAALADAFPIAADLALLHRELGPFSMENLAKIEMSPELSTWDLIIDMDYGPHDPALQEG